MLNIWPIAGFEKATVGYLTAVTPQTRIKQAANESVDKVCASTSFSREGKNSGNSIENFQIENTFLTETENFCHNYVRGQTTNQLIQLKLSG